MTETPERVALQQELDALNAEYTAIVAKRTAWMDAHMADFAKHPLGTVVYTSDGKLVGKVAGYYRYHRDDPRYDTSMTVHYRFANGGNTSSEMLCTDYLMDGDELAARLESRAQSLRRPSHPHGD